MTFYELEKICKKRKRIFIIIIFLVIIFILITLFLVLTKKEKIKIKKNEINITTPKIEKKEIKKRKKEIKSINFILPEFNEKKEIKKNYKISKKESNNSKITLITNNIPSFDTCINLAKKYLKEKNYKKALKWAKFANIQDKKNPISWIISAKALYAMGKKEEAIKLLKIYNRYYKNKTVQKFIKEFNEK